MPKKVKLFSSSRNRPGRRNGTDTGRRSRPPIARMMKIHEMLAAGRFPNCSGLAEVFEVSYKTVQRDIDFMRDQLLLPIDYDSGRHGFRYTKAVEQFPMITVSQGELVALLVAQKAVQQYRGTSFEAPLRSAFDKLAGSLDSETSISLQELSSAVSFRPTGIPQGEMKTYDILADAVLSSHQVEFDYLGLKAKAPERRRVEPLHLSCIADQWYLIANDLVRAARRTFALTRIRKPKNLKKPFRKPADFSLQNMLADSFSAFEAAGAVEVKIRFSSLASRLVDERKWHKSEKKTHLPGDRLELTLKVGLAPDLEKWILGWGEHAEVLSPPELRERIAWHATRMHEIYK